MNSWDRILHQVYQARKAGEVDNYLIPTEDKDGNPGVPLEVSIPKGRGELNRVRRTDMNRVGHSPITLTQDGVEYTWVGSARYVRPGEHFIDYDGVIQTYKGDITSDIICPVVKPVPVKHVFGEVVFVETGEYRPVYPGEWCLAEMGHIGTYPIYRQRPGSTMKSYKILRADGLRSEANSCGEELSPDVRSA